MLAILLITRSSLEESETVLLLDPINVDEIKIYIYIYIYIYIRVPTTNTGIDKQIYIGYKHISLCQQVHSSAIW